MPNTDAKSKPNADPDKAEEEKKPLRRPVWRRMAEVPSKETEWSWPERVPLGAVTVLDGDPGLGKSTLLLDEAAKVSRGERGERRGVLLLSAEDDPEKTIRPRLDAAKAEQEHVIILDAMETDDGEEPPVLPYDLDALETLIVAEEVVLLIVDPLMAYLDGRIDSHNDQQVRLCLHRLKLLAAKHNVAIVLLRHLNKDEATKNPLYRGGASIGIIGAARSGLLVGRAPDNPDQFILAATKNNLGPLAPSLRYEIEPCGDVGRIKWLGEAPFRAADLTATRATNPKKHDQAESFLKWNLKHGPARQASLEKQAKEQGISTATLKRAKKKCGVLSEQRADGWWWSWPTDMPGVRGSSDPSPGDDPLTPRPEEEADTHNVFSVN